MSTPAIIMLFAGLGIILWAITSSDDSHKSYIDQLTGKGP